MSYGVRSGHGYGNQRRGNSSSYGYPGQRKRQGNIKPLQHSQSVDQTNNPNFIIVAKALPTWDQPSQEFKLSNNSEPQQLAHTLAQTANHRKLELSLIET